MTQKVNGRVQQGFWDERKVVYMQIAGDFTLPTVAAPTAPSVWDVNGSVQIVMNILQTRGTIIAFNSTTAGLASVIYGTSSGEFDPALDTVPLAELNAQLALVPVNGVPAVPGTPSYVATVLPGFAASAVQVPA